MAGGRVTATYRQEDSPCWFQLISPVSLCRRPPPVPCPHHPPPTTSDLSFIGSMWTPWAKAGSSKHKAAAGQVFRESGFLLTEPLMVPHEPGESLQSLAFSVCKVCSAAPWTAKRLCLHWLMCPICGSSGSFNPQRLCVTPVLVLLQGGGCE